MSAISLGIVEPVVASPSHQSNLTVDRHLVTFEMERKLQANCSGVKEVGGAVVGAGVGDFVVGSGVVGTAVVGSGVAGASVVGSGVRDFVVGSGVAGASIVGSDVALLVGFGVGAAVAGSGVGDDPILGFGVGDAPLVGSNVAGGVTPAGFGRYTTRATIPTTRRSARKQLMAIHPRDTGRSYHFLDSSAAGGG